MKEEKFYEKTYFVIGTCSFHAAMSLAGCGGGGTTATTAAAGGETTAAASEAATEAASTDDTNLSDVEKIIKEAEGMSMEELAKKASKSPTERPSTVLVTPAAERVRCRYLSNICSLSIRPTKWNMSGSSRRTTRSLSS